MNVTRSAFRPTGALADAATDVRHPRSVQIAIAAMIVVLMTLPFAHVIALRNTALAVALIATVAARRALDVPRLPFLTLFAVWAAIGAASLLWSIDPAYSRGELKSELLYPFAVFALCYSLAVDRSVLRRWAAATGAALLLSFFEMLTYLFDSSWPLNVPLFSGNLTYSSWLITMYPFALAFALTSTLASRWRKLAGGAAILIVVAGVLTFNRAFLIVFLLATFALLCWAAWGSTGRIRLAVAFATLAVLVAALFVVAHQHNARRDAHVPADPVMAMQRDVRWQLWHVGISQIISHPLQGAGFGRGTMRHEFAREFNAHPDLWHAHNLVLNYGMQMGLPGIALILAVFTAALWRLSRAYGKADADLKPLIAAGIVMVVSVFLKNQPDDDFVRQSALIYWATLGAVLGAAARAERARRSHFEPAGSSLHSSDAITASVSSDR